MALTAKKVYAILKRQISDMEAKLNSPVRYRGTVATADLLPLNPDIGDMYNIESKSVHGEAGMNVAWNGVVWDTMGAPIDMSLYLTKEEAETVIQRLVTEYFEKNPVKPGATTEQAQQIEQNKTDVASLKTETSSLKESISNKITKFYASSQGETHLADSDDGKIMDMMLYGKSEQKQYSGKNLLNATLQTTTQNGVTCTNNGDGTYTLNGTATAIVTFDIAHDVFYSSFRLIGCPVKGIHDASYELQARTNNLIYGYDTGDGKNIKADEKFFIRIRINTGIVCNNLLFKPMITTDLTATYDDFEPYTGGIPSPNPDYPQEIKSVVNPTVKVCGKNLLKATLQTTTKNGVTCTANGDGTYTLNGTATENIEFVIYKIQADGKSYKITGCPKGLSSQTAYLDLTNYIDTAVKDFGDGSTPLKLSGNNEFIVQMTVISGYTCNNLIFKPMIVDAEKYSDATYDDFEPYHEQTVTLPYTLNAIPVESGGNVTIDGQQYIADYVDVERGKLVRSVFVIKFTGAESWLYSDTDDEKLKRFGFKIAVKGKQYVGLSNYIINAGIGIINKENAFVFYGEWIDIRITRFTSPAEFNNFLSELNSSGKPLIVIYALVTPEEIDLTPEQIQAYKSLSTNYPVTNIEVSSDQLNGYTVFNYPISMANGWNYVKQQLNDNRNYIYDMDAQSAEAYVNSEYAVALTELEV